MTIPLMADELVIVAWLRCGWRHPDRSPHARRPYTTSTWRLSIPSRSMMARGW